MVGRGGIYGDMHGDGQPVAPTRDDDWRQRVQIAMRCPYGTHHGGCRARQLCQSLDRLHNDHFAQRNSVIN